MVLKEKICEDSLDSSAERQPFDTKSDRDVHEAGCKCDGNERSERSKTTVHRKRYHLNCPLFLFTPNYKTMIRPDNTQME
jgi:hypothetical protein